MAWVFQLAAECGLKRDDADSFANYFFHQTWTLSDGLKSTCENRVFQDSEENWWCSVIPNGVSRSGVRNEEDIKQMMELAMHFYQHLRASPSFRYALVGIEIDAFRTISELVTDELLGTHFDGLVISEELLKQAKRVTGFELFKPGYLWKPFTGRELY